MVDSQISFLIKAVSTLRHVEDDSTQNLLKSFYLMRCRELTKGHGLPEKYFSSKLRCPRCFIEWEKGTEVKVQTIKLSKNQRRRIRQQKINIRNKEHVEKRIELLKSNKIEQVCTFCRNTTTILSVKPSNPQKLAPVVNNKQCNEPINNDNTNSINNYMKQKLPIRGYNKVQTQSTRKPEVNVYSKTNDAFSLVNKSNTLQGVVKQNKVIKNNKRKKDKFAGLCQQAVLASAKMKEVKKMENKLNLFLKPSS